jgi:cation diffusion facilitator CzcD-associated flavoprotein CzcO
VSAVRDPSVAIIGAGMSGLCMAIMLREAGITDITVYEKAGALGGTWRDNTYPGLFCDVPSRFYQFSFAKNPRWSHLFSPGAEIQAYFAAVAERYRLLEAIRFNTEVTRAELRGSRWQLTTRGGEQRTVDFLISAAGILHHPRYPEIAGLDSFAGAAFHSARWDHSIPLDGQRIAIVGTGSTGVQLVCGLVDRAAKIELYQRTAQWVIPFENREYRRLTRAAHAAFPVLDDLAYARVRRQLGFFSRALIAPGWRRRALDRACRKNLDTVRDPELRRRLTPTYQPMCKRLVVSSRFYDAMQQPNVDLVTDGIDHVEPRGIVTSDGALHELDVIALATGFDSHAFVRPVQLVGREGITLDELWQDGPFGYLTVAVPHFPNFFMLLGPHSPVGNYSLTAISEAQAAHVLGWIRRWRRGEFDTVAPTVQATAAFNASLKAAMPGTIWVTGCDSWYLGKDGLPELWPWTPDEHRVRLIAPPPAADFELTPHVADATNAVTAR